ncbi:MAG: carbohydrate ABC transporter permease [Chloroflexi bacterium]|nr:carbohydrate ABC transporter permease [Chloroflexota bacterium]
MILSYVLLGSWTFVVLFPLYWMVVTSFKLPIQVDSGPFYIPFVDFEPSLHAWQYILVGDLANDTRRNFINTVVVATTSTCIAMLLGSAAAYGLTRFNYRPKLGMVLAFILCVLLVIVLWRVGVPLSLGILLALVLFVIVLLTIGKSFRRALGNSDIAFWMVSQRILPPIAVVIPIYIMFQLIGLLDTWPALIITYVAANLPIVIWLMRDYFMTIPIELEESAAIDGASRYRTFTSVVLPLSVPGFVATFLFVLVFAWNEYLFALFLTNANAQTLPVTIAAQNATRGPQWWYMSVLVLVMIAPVIGMAIMLERYMAKGLLVGAVKG